jgi:polyisoprenoid-binding protein YceI
MKKIILLAIALSTSMVVNAQLYTSTSSDVSFDSKTPMEDIYAQTKKAKAAVNVNTKKVMIRIKMISFKFEKPLMEEHFNEKYVETEKYPDAKFDGVIQGEDDLSKNGTYNVKVKGILEIHGVKQDRTLEGVLTVADGSVDLKTEFSVALKDHKIKVPKVVVKNIAESVNIKAHFVCAPRKKK